MPKEAAYKHASAQTRRSLQALANAPCEFEAELVRERACTKSPSGVSVVSRQYKIPVTNRAAAATIIASRQAHHVPVPRATKAPKSSGITICATPPPRLPH